MRDIHGRIQDLAMGGGGKISSEASYINYTSEASYERSKYKWAGGPGAL